MICQRCKNETPDESLYCCICGKRLLAAPPQRKKRRRPRGSGSVYQIKGNRAKPWAATAGNGKLLGTFATSGEAIKELDKFNALKAPIERRTYTFAEVYAAWSERHFQRISPKTKAGYELSYAKAAALYNRRMRDIKSEDYQAIIDDLAAQGFSYSLCSKQRLLFSALCQYAMQQDIIDRNYGEALDLPRMSTKKTRVLSANEIDAIRTLVDDKTHGEAAKIALTLIFTGLRINELLKTRNENVFIDEQYMITGEKTEAGRNRVVPLNAEILPYIAEWHKRGGEWLMQTPEHAPLQDDRARKQFAKLMKHCGIEGVTFHTCRHTTATLLVAADVPPAIAKQILGHADFSTTVNVYTHSAVTELVKHINRL